MSTGSDTFSTDESGTNSTDESGTFSTDESGTNSTDESGTNSGGVDIADAGYLIPEPGALQSAGCHSSPHLLIATKKDWEHLKAGQEISPPRGRIPQDLTTRQRMERTLRTQQGKNLYRCRSQTVEPVFGQIKGARRCDRLLLRGYRYAAGEWQLICATHNLLKCWRSGKGVKH